MSYSIIEDFLSNPCPYNANGVADRAKKLLTSTNAAFGTHLQATIFTSAPEKTLASVIKPLYDTVYPLSVLLSIYKVMVGSPERAKLKRDILNARQFGILVYEHANGESSANAIFKKTKQGKQALSQNLAEYGGYASIIEDWKDIYITRGDRAQMKPNMVFKTYRSEYPLK